jgi:hypothetical protein
MYIYIFEDGEVCYSNDVPTPNDLDAMANGLLTIMHVEGDRLTWFPDGGNVAECKVVDGYHVP